MKKQYKIIVAHPGKQHSFQLATALKKEGMLYKYITTVYDRPKSYTHFFKNFLCGKLKNKANTRSTTQLSNDDIIQYKEISGLFLIFIGKIFGTNSKTWKKLNSKVADMFGKKVAKFAIKNNVDAVICFDSNCTVLFSILKDKAPNIKRIMDVSIANRLFMKEEFIQDIEKTKDENLRLEQAYLWNDKNIKRFKDEIDYSQYFIVASNIVKESLKFSDVKDEQIVIVPYGVNLDKFKFVEKSEKTKKLKLIYVGQITYRKGLHHLLKVVSKFDKQKVSLKLAGEYLKNSPLYTNYCNVENIEFLGFVTRDKLAEIYQESDVFIFPTLGEGFGLVVLEAMSCGLPVIISDHAGGNDAITDYKDGIVFKAGDDYELEKAIKWFIENPQKISEMGKNAYNKVQNYTWDAYYKNVVSTIKNWLEE